MAKATEAASKFKLSIPDVGAGSGRTDSRQIMLEVPTVDDDGNDGPPQKMTRNDYIRLRFNDGVDRGTIRKEVAALQGKDVSYQVIFQATKGMENSTTKKRGGADTAEGEE
jgi:hypothetical protein